MTGFIVGGKDIGGPENVSIVNFSSPGVVRFRNGKRGPSVHVSEVVLHETVTTSAKSTVDVLLQRGLGVHLIVGPDGVVAQHADLQDDVTWHGSQHNGASVGIEVVNPYEPRFLPKNGPWTACIEAPWCASQKDHDGVRRYVLPTPAQVEATALVVNWLTSAASAPLAIPQLWPGLQHTQRLAFGRVPADAHAAPGVHAHMYWDHADGAWLVLYAWLRFEAGLGPEEAYAAADLRATGASAKGVDLSDYFTQNPYLQS